MKRIRYINNLKNTLNSGGGKNSRNEIIVISRRYINSAGAWHEEMSL
jgi:hypothetical protein